MDKHDQAPYDTLAMRTMMRRLTEVTDTMHNQGLYIDMSKLKNAARLGLEKLQGFNTNQGEVERDAMAHGCLAVVLLRNLPRKKKKRYKRMQWDVLRKSEQGAPFKTREYLHDRQEFMRGVAEVFRQFRDPKNAVAFVNPKAVMQGKKI